MDTGLAGCAALVTGASGGIGHAVARLLAAEGCRLALLAHRNAGALEERVRRELGAGAGTLVARCDVGDPASVDEAIGAAAARFGGIRIAVASAGIWPEEDRALDEMAPERIESVIRTNLLGAIYTARSFLAQIRRHGVRGSSLVLVGSTAGRFGEAGHAEYAASKAGLLGLMLSYKNEVARVDPEGRVNLVEPGWTLTPMTEGHLDDGTVRHVLATRPLRQIARADDVAAGILFFASERLSGHVTGERLTIAGGMEGRLLWDGDAIDTDAVRARLR